MGNPNPNSGDPDTIPQHPVLLTKDFFVMQNEVKHDLYDHVMGVTGEFTTDSSKRSVVNVTWTDAVLFANKLSILDGREPCYRFKRYSRWYGKYFIDDKCTGWRLLTEAEWEYAARGGESYIYAGTDSLKALESLGTNGCEKLANGYGLCDMTGGVREWVADRYRRKDYTEQLAIDPTGPSEGIGILSKRIRGEYLGREVWNRTYSRRDHKYRNVGIRLGFTASAEP